MPNNRKRKLAIEEPQRSDKRRKTKAPSLVVSLPPELFHQILRELPISSVLAVKFTCRAFYAKTLYHDGSEVVDLEKAVVDEMPPRDMIMWRVGNPKWTRSIETQWKEIHAVAALLIDFERRDSKKLDKLTCSICARCKPHGATGFGDLHFAQRRSKRWCNECCYAAVLAERYPCPFMVLGVSSKHCDVCKKVVPRRRPRGCKSCPGCTQTSEA